MAPKRRWRASQKRDELALAARELRQASIHVVEGQSLVVPLIIEGLPPEIDVLGRRWLRKREFHMTAVAARVIDEVARRVPAAWDRVVEVASGRELGPVQALEEVRRVSHPDKLELQTLIVMARCPGLSRLYDDLTAALHTTLVPPPAHITLYSTDPAQGGSLTSTSWPTGRPRWPPASNTLCGRRCAFPDTNRRTPGRDVREWRADVPATR